MSIWISADCHFNHENIIKYCNRPFKDIQEMDDTIIKNWNEVVKKDDTVYHLGDFYFKYEGKDLKFWENQLNGKIIHIEGNHDKSRTSILKFGFAEYGGLSILMTHVPSADLRSVPDFCDIEWAAHYHDKWKYKVLDYPVDKKPKIVINVGVDQWDFKPINIDSLVKYSKKLIREELR